MRRVVHKLLSAAPTSLIGVAGIYFGVNPEKLSTTWQAFVLKMQDNLTFWAAVIFVSSYIFVWWLTSLDPEDRHQKIKRELLHWYYLTVESEQSMRQVATDEDAEKLLQEINSEQNAAFIWISANMSPAAAKKFLSRPGGSFSYLWPGQHSQEMVRRRDGTIDTLRDRASNIQDMMNFDSWDGPAPTVLYKFQKVIGRWERNSQA